ncbi:hypothetical protein [Yeosuana marina]|uniref:hypothetical protein n=1 Tax=Yeosuana marina TaxID=1565536 RepID=UPI0030C7CA25
MKTLKTLVLILAVSFSSMLFANETKPVTKASSLSSTISELLESPKFRIAEDVNALVTITFNKNDEMVVLCVDSESETVVKFIKERLNYKKVNSNLYSEYGKFIVPVRLTPNK